MKGRPEIDNLVAIFSSVSKKGKEELISNYQNETFAKFKLDLAEILVDHLGGISEKIRFLLDDKRYLEKILNDGSDKANDMASENMKKLKEMLNKF